MKIKAIVIFLLACMCAEAVIVDRIAIVADNKIIKDSDIAEDLRLTAFLNQEPLVATPTLRKKAADRLLDQEVIRNEVEAGGYPKASVEEVRQYLESIIKSRYPTEADFKKRLGAYGISEDDLKARLQWQLTVLQFIDIRFRTSASVTDDEIRQYYNTHRNAFSSDLESSRAKIENVLTGEQTNKEFYDWLERRRKAMSINYLEGDLR